MSVNKKNSDGSYNQYASKPYVTKDNIGLSKVENKNSEDIRGEITSKNVTDALGYTPVSEEELDLVKDIINGTADDQFIYDTEAKMTKVVPENVSKGIVAMIGGKTQKVVQLVNEIQEYNTATLISKNNSDGTFSVTANNTSGAGFIKIYGLNMIHNQTIIGHKYYIRTYGINASSDVKITNDTCGIDMSSGNSYIGEANASKGFYIRIASGSTLNITFKLQIFDITVMGLDKSTTAQLDEIFKDIVPYTEGSLWNAPVEKVVLEGKNLVNFDTLIKGRLDNGVVGYDTGTTTLSSNNNTISCVTNTTYRGFITDFIPVKSGEQYYLSFEKSDAVIANCSFFGSDKQFVVNQNKDAASAITVPSNASYIRIGFNFNAAGNHTITNLKFELGSTPTPYTPYTKTTLSLERIVDNLPDYGASAGDVYNYADFEETVYHHKVIEVNPSKLNWKKYSDNLFYSSDNIFKKYDENAKIGLISNKYTTKDIATWMSTYSKESECICLQPSATNQLWICDLKQTDLTAFVNSLTDVKLYAELPQEELIPLTDLLLPFKCEPGGTVTFENEHNLDVPNTVIYEKEMK